MTIGERVGEKLLRVRELAAAIRARLAGAGDAAEEVLEEQVDRDFAAAAAELAEVVYIARALRHEGYLEDAARHLVEVYLAHGYPRKDALQALIEHRLPVFIVIRCAWCDAEASLENVSAWRAIRTVDEFGVERFFLGCGQACKEQLLEAGPRFAHGFTRADVEAFIGPEAARSRAEA